MTEEKARHLDPEAFKSALSTLMYDTGDTRELTLEAIRRAKECMGTNHPDSLFLQGIIRYNYEGEGLKYLTEAMERGCSHPMMYYLLAEVHRSDVDNMGRAKSPDKAREYFTKAIAGTYNIIYSEHILLMMLV